MRYWHRIESTTTVCNFEIEFTANYLEAKDWGWNRHPDHSELDLLDWRFVDGEPEEEDKEKVEKEIEETIWEYLDDNYHKYI